MKNLSVILLVSLLISCNSKKKKDLTNTEDGRPSLSQIFSEFDADKDGKLSRAEVNGPLADDFDAIDTNQDGFLSETELTAAPGPKHEEEQIIDKSEINTTIKTLAINTEYFIQDNIIGDITQEKITLSGIETLCYVIKTHSQATEHQMGPWCPRHIEDGMEKGGLWFKDDKVYDVSGHFIAQLDEFYSDDKWKLYREDGTVKYTETEKACLAAAKPDVEEAYNNYCVECLPEYFKDQVTTFFIPVKPVYLNTSQNLGRTGIGIAFNGVNFDPPAPTHAILAAHTIAPLDDHGGHVNPHGGYHYHAVTGGTKEIEQPDVHAPIVGYAIDGFGIYALKDKNDHLAADLDECGGHSDAVRGYHYHAGAVGDNQIIKCLHGLPGYTQVQE
ncbi:YHYH protein [Cellulophaga baltica]|uniref:YHYH protein n=1 Tax=Cellulophaga baltica TaxID=76594 RepID=UPI003F4A9713